MVIALTHMWTKNDEYIASNVPGIDLVLAGHDHIRYIKSHQNAQNSAKIVPLIKSGSDFHDMSVIDIHFGVDQAFYDAANQKAAQSPQEEKMQIEYSESDNMLFEITQINVDSKEFQPNAPINELANNIMAELKERMNKEVGHFSIEMEARKKVIRT